MPRVARFTIAAVEDLFRQLRFAPRETRLREMAAAEALVGDLEPEGTYPEDFVVFRVTGYRPDGKEAPVTFVGAALIADLVNLVQRLSMALELPVDHDGREALPMRDVARALRVSPKTVQRYRRAGLVRHYVHDRRRTRLVCFRDALDRFRERHEGRLGRAAAFTRVDADVERAIVDGARALQRSGLSLNMAARRLARRHGRAHETVRGLLRRHDERATAPIFDERGPLGPRDLGFVERAWSLGASVGEIAARLGRSSATIRRGLHRARAERLRAVAPTWIDLPTFDLDDADAVILGAPAARADLRWTADLDAGPLVEQRERDGAGRAGGTDADLDALVAAYNLLKRRAARAIAALPGWPAAGAIDAIETDLRWATRIKRRIVVGSLPWALARIAQHTTRPLVTLPAERIQRLIRLAIAVIGEEVETIDPGRDQRLDRRIAFAMDRALASAGEDAAGDTSGRAAARHEAGALRMPGALAGLTAWESVTEPSPSLVARAEAVEPALRDAWVERYGLGGAPPCTVATLAGRRGVSASAMARIVRKAEVAALRARRATMSDPAKMPGTGAGA